MRATDALPAPSILAVPPSIGAASREGVKTLASLPGLHVSLPRVPIDPDDMSDLMRAEIERHRRELPALIAALPALAISLSLLAAAVASILSGPPV